MRTRFVLFGAVVPAILAAAGIGWVVHAEGKADIPDTANPPFDRIADLEVAQDTEIGAVFRANYDFPSRLIREERPWEAYDFRKKDQAEKYLTAVLDYAREGQGSPPQWAVQADDRRRWYHMPWMGPGDRGREYTHGFTPEHRVYLRDVGVEDHRAGWCRQTWAISYYNPVGAYALGQVWAPVFAGETEPNLGQEFAFPRGTVVIKLLYTQIQQDELPQLVGAPEVQIRIHGDSDLNDSSCPEQKLSTPKQTATLRLLQFDIAVRVRNELTGPDGSGWVFGTFVYDGRLPGADPWRKLKPLGLMWGNDPDLTDELAKTRSPAESHILGPTHFREALGRGGRLNGPLDDPRSACLSCHMTAQTPSLAEMKPPKLDGGMPADQQWRITSCWFRALPPTKAFGVGPKTVDQKCGVGSDIEVVSTDSSLQLAAAIKNFRPTPQGQTPYAKMLNSIGLNPDQGELQTFPITRD